MGLRRTLMSVLKRAVVFSRKARSDNVSILTYTLREWGQEQQRVYTGRLLTALDRLAEFPELGERRQEVSQGLRSWHVDQHIIYYRVTAKTLRVVRIRHERTAPLGPDGL